MSIKKKLGMGMATAALGLSLIGGGTYAYFSDTTEAKGSFTNGTLDLGINKTTIVDIKNLKPGDYMFRDFQLSNDGSLDMKQVLLNSSYEVTDVNGDNGTEDFGDHIMVEYLYKVEGKENVVFRKTLSELNNNPIEVLKNVPAGKKQIKFTVQFKFIDNEKDQNIFQGDSLKLKWNFEAKQKDGESK
ncbi:TasA family protein [Heyndrickxia vini]|uniref:Cell division protein FtsN n=1 Tax=Heyndrickxia vini TaxID=1476025 RepID=A0ABX7E6V5_9BACI|nr:TasA family protein [Heyndrickxia vini]QQZ10949.1 cell division protein FtsN [Heyndrickxia vini]